MKKNSYLVALILLIFFVISFLTNILGPIIPAIIQDFSLSLTMVAVLPFSFFIAYGVLSIPSGIMVEKWGGKTVTMLAFSIAFVGALVFGLYPSYGVAIFSLFLIGMGMAMLQVVINPLLREAGGEENLAFFSVLGQFFFGLASFLSPLVYSYLVLNIEREEKTNWLFSTLRSLVPENLPWVSLYWVFAVISLLMLIIIGLSKFPKVELKVDERVGALKTHMELLKNPMVLLFFLGIFFYVGSEQGVANWMSEFLAKNHQFDPQTEGARAVSLFWGLMTAGTFLGLFLVKVMDSRHLLIAFAFAAIVCLTAALFGSAQVSYYGFAMMGFFIAVMWPIILSLALNSVKEHHGSLSGILITAIAGGAVVPFIIGWIGDSFGLKAGLCLLYFTLAYILSIGIWARPLVNNKKENPILQLKLLLKMN